MSKSLSGEFFKTSVFTFRSASSSKSVLTFKMMKFCNTCNNLLHPRENREKKQLEYVCKAMACNYVETNVESNVVFRNDIVKDTETNLRAILRDNNQDPTLNRDNDEACPKCGYAESVIFLAEQTAKSTRLQLIHVCCSDDCGHKWFGTEQKEPNEPDGPADEIDEALEN
jgi:DNA-directed RNA polymerase II subunit RPB9